MDWIPAFAGMTTEKKPISVLEKKLSLDHNDHALGRFAVDRFGAVEIGAAFDLHALLVPSVPPDQVAGRVPPELVDGPGPDFKAGHVVDRDALDEL